MKHVLDIFHNTAQYHLLFYFSSLHILQNQIEKRGFLSCTSICWKVYSKLKVMFKTMKCCIKTSTKQTYFVSQQQPSLLSVSLWESLTPVHRFLELQLIWQRKDMTILRLLEVQFDNDRWKLAARALTTLMFLELPLFLTLKNKKNKFQDDPRLYCFGQFW